MALAFPPTRQAYSVSGTLHLLFLHIDLLLIVQIVLKCHLLKETFPDHSSSIALLHFALQPSSQPLSASDMPDSLSRSVFIACLLFYNTRIMNRHTDFLSPESLALEHCLVPVGA